jgi:hypothetical protein
MGHVSRAFRQPDMFRPRGGHVLQTVQRLAMSILDEMRPVW